MGQPSLISVKCRGLSCRQNAVRVSVLDLNGAKTVLCSIQPIDGHVKSEIRPRGDVICDRCNLGDGRLTIRGCVDALQKRWHLGAIAKVEVDSRADAATPGISGA